MIATTRLLLDTPQGTDIASGGPADFTEAFGVLDNAALFGSGTLAGRPTAASVVNGYVYLCTDVSAAFVTVAGAWVFIPTGGSSQPVGTVQQYSGASVPADPDGVQRWHVCDGSAISRSTYATLFAAIGTTWGTGDGSTTFNIPDMRGRVPVGAGSGTGLTTRALAAEGGEENHALLAAESGVNGSGVTGTGTTGGNSVDHSHISPDGNYFVTNNPASAWSYGSSYQAGISNEALSVTVSGGNYTGGESQTHTHASPALALTARNADSTHNNLQPFAVVQHIVKIL